MFCHFVGTKCKYILILCLVFLSCYINMYRKDVNTRERESTFASQSQNSEDFIVRASSECLRIYGLRESHQTSGYRTSVHLRIFFNNIPNSISKNQFTLFTLIFCRLIGSGTEKTTVSARQYACVIFSFATSLYTVNRYIRFHTTCHSISNNEREIVNLREIRNKKFGNHQVFNYILLLFMFWEKINASV